MSASRPTPAAARPEQSRARYPDDEGFVERDGVRVFWEVYGEGEPTILLLPTWSIVHSRCWKTQIPYLARHFRVLTFDGRGNGRSDRPSEPERLPRARVRRRRARRAGRHRHRAGGARGAVARRGAGAAARRRAPRARRGHGVHRPGAPAAAGSRRAPTAEQMFMQRHDAYDGLGEVEPPLLARALRGLRRVLLLAGASPSRTRPSRARTRSAGRSRPTPRRSSRPSSRRGSRTRTSVRELAARIRCPVLVIHGRRRRGQRPHDSGARPRRAHRRRVRDASRARATARRPATR